MRLLTAREVAELLQVALPRVYELVREGTLPCVRLGRQIRFHEVKLMEWIEQGGSALPKDEARDAA